MKLATIQDIDKLPSVLDIKKVEKYLVELVELIRSTNVGALEGAEAINNLISYQGYNEVGLSVETSRAVLEWIKETYDEKNNDLVMWNSGNLANLTCKEAKEFIENRLKETEAEFERKELVETLEEIEIKT
jgi:hypothetical protein